MNISNIFRRPVPSHLIARLTEQFLNGCTTPAQEQALFAYYRRSSAGSLPDELEQYRPMMEWYAAMTPASRQLHRRIIAAAAIVAVLLSAGISISTLSGTNENSLYTCYKGSYIIRNGQRISDTEQIYPALIHAEYTADSLAAVAERQAYEMECDPERAIVDMAVAGISDPELASQIRCEFLSSENDKS